MSEPRFFARRGPFPVADIVRLTDASVRSNTIDDREVYDVASLDEAAAGDVTFFSNAKYKESLLSCQAGAVFVTEKHVDLVPEISAALIVSDPQRAFAQTIAHFYPESLKSDGVFDNETSISEGAFIHPAAELEGDVKIEAGAVVGERVQIGRGSVICASAVVSAGVSIGRNCSIGPGAVLSHAILGDNVIIHAGVKVGQDGFGYAMGPEGHLKVPQIGRVIIQRDVEIGANSTIDRGALKDTVIGEGTKIDNLVQIGHNVMIGRNCIIVALTGISGSVVLEDFVVLGGQVGIADHLRIGKGAQVASSSGVNCDVPAGGRWGGVPAKPLREVAREIFMLERLAKGKLHIGRRGSDE